MKRILVFFYLLICSGLVEAQHVGEAVKKEKAPFEIGFAVESLYRDFSRGSFLGDSYQMGIGYRLMTRFGFRGYPELGVYAGRQQVTVAENRFLGDFFDQARTGDSGWYLGNQIRINLLDRECMRRATDIQLRVGVLVDLF